ncbi:hypothetical protein Q6311_28015, partial [Klebsiella variicola]
FPLAVEREGKRLKRRQESAGDVLRLQPVEEKLLQEARRIFEALSEGGTVTTPLAEVDWAERFGMVTDRFGVPWLVLAVKG